MAKHRKPTPPPLVDKVGLWVYMASTGVVAAVLASAFAGWPW